MRVAITLDDFENEHFQRLRTTKWRREGAAWTFWKAVCAKRGLDYKTLIERTALPLGHGQHWCFPYSLKAPPITLEFRLEADRAVAFIGRLNRYG